MHINGIDMDSYFRVNEITGRGLAPQEIETISVLGRDGSYYAGKRLPSRELTVRVTIIASDPESLRERIVEINEILTVDEPVEIQFSDEPQYTYFGIPSGVSEDYEFTYFHQTEFSIFCPSPYKYGGKITAEFPSDYVSVKNTGKADVGPVYELEVLEDSSFALIQNQYNDYMLIGNPADLETPTFSKYERVFYSNGRSLAGWAEANPSEVDGSIGGNIISSDGMFIPDGFGEGSGWHGPAIKSSISEPLQDFQMRAWVRLINGTDPSHVGRVEISLLDVNGNQVAKVAMSDSQSHLADAYGMARLGITGDHRMLIYENGSEPGVWNNFAGVLQIKREAGRWYAYIARGYADDHHSRRYVTWPDYYGEYTAPVSQVVVRFATYGSYTPPPEMEMHSLYVDKINLPSSSNEIPEVMRRGDVLTLDHENEVVLLNGEERNDLVAFGSDFFKLRKGSNELFVYPNNTFNTKAIYREAFL